MLTKNCGTELVCPRSILPSLAVADASVHWADVEQCHCWRGPSAAGCSGKLAEGRICTVKSPRDHCLSPVLGLLFPTRHRTVLPGSDPAWERGRSRGVWGTGREALATVSLNHRLCFLSQDPRSRLEDSSSLIPTRCHWPGSKGGWEVVSVRQF